VVVVLMYKYATTPKKEEKKALYISNEGSGSMRLRNYLLAHESIWLTTVLPDDGEQEARGGSWLTVKVIFDNIKFSINQKNIREVKPVFK
jgi:hypothetical protein